jgi:hypothetical protein
MKQHTALPKFHWLGLAVVLTVVVPAGMAQVQTDIATASLPDAPSPQQSTPPPAPDATPQVSTSTSQANAQDKTQKKQPESDQELKREQNQQRILGVMPMFNVVNGANSIPPLRPKQKFQLFWKSSTDPFIFGLDAIIAGIGQAENSNAGTKTVQNPDGTTRVERWGFPQGISGYFQRYATTYADTFDGNFWGNAVLPVLLKEDPRFYRMGTGSFSRRFLWAASTTVWCRRDNGKWGPNYANVAGNFIGGGIANLYYPSEEGGFEKTTVSALTVTAEGTFGAELLEFWPDIEHHFLKKRHQNALAPAP